MPAHHARGSRRTAPCRSERAGVPRPRGPSCTVTCSPPMIRRHSMPAPTARRVNSMRRSLATASNSHRHGVHGPQEAEVLGREGVRRKAHRVGDSGHDEQVIAEAFALAAVAFDGQVVGLEGHGEEAVDVRGCLAGELDARRGDVCSAVAPHGSPLRPPQGPGHAVALVLVGHLRRGAEEAEPRAGRVDRVGAGDELPCRSRSSGRCTPR